MDASDAPKSLLRQWVHQRHQALLEIVMSSWQEGMKALEPDDALVKDLLDAAGAKPDDAELLDTPAPELGPYLGMAIDAMESAPSQGEVLRTLLEGLRPFVERCALFIVKQGIPNLYAARGFDSEAPKLGAPVMPTPKLEALLGGKLHTLRDTGEAYASMLVPLSRFEASEAMILALRLRRKAVALLLVDSGLRTGLDHPSEVRALAHSAEACLSFLAGQKEDERPSGGEVAPHQPTVQIVHPIQESAPALDPKVRATAERLARVLVGDIELYFPQKVAQGQQQGNLYGPLREELDRSRATFLDRYGEDVENQHHIFINTIVQHLCGGDASRLGPAPWAPKVRPGS